MSTTAISINPTMFQETSKFNPKTPTKDIGAVATRGGLITIDTPLAEYFKLLHIQTGGNVLILGMDNQVIPYLGISSDSWIWAVGYAVVSAATVDGQALTTTASNIQWYGGF